MDKETKELLKDCELALGDWLHTYAHELCDSKLVRRSMKRISYKGGTVAYIAKLRCRLREKLDSTPTKKPA